MTIEIKSLSNISLLWITTILIRQPETELVSPDTPSRVVSEGSTITLSCNITRELTHPTYLSVTWSLKNGTTSEEILTFGPDGGVETAPNYTQRFSDGGVRLMSWRNGSFVLVISGVRRSDEGIYECTAVKNPHTTYIFFSISSAATGSN
uniref:Ig-like domain-containing protein n=1 Tax=Lates calcarifer TaxID=8187 RepID=A0A4W6F1P2_LATCA